MRPYHAPAIMADGGNSAVIETLIMHWRSCFQKHLSDTKLGLAYVGKCSMVQVGFFYSLKFQISCKAHIRQAHGHDVPLLELEILESSAGFHGSTGFHGGGLRIIWKMRLRRQ